MTNIFASYLLTGALITRHPIIIVTLLIFQTLTLIVIINRITASRWRLYMLFLIFLGGLLIIFAYLCALVPNEIFKKIFNLNRFFIITLPLMLILLKFSKQKHSVTRMGERSTPFIIRATSSHLTLTLMILYLLISLLVIIRIRKKSKTPLKINAYEQPKKHTSRKTSQLSPCRSSRANKYHPHMKFWLPFRVLFNNPNCYGYFPRYAL